MNNIYKKLHEARKYIKTCGAKKQGRNEFSKYDYFTPEQTAQLVFEACENQKLITLFDLVRNEFGCNGILTIVDIETPDSKLTFNMATDIPVMKATNATQQLGGAVTYTERYLLMTAFDIKDNNLDLDSKDNSDKKTDQPTTDKELKWLNKWSDKEHTKELEFYWKVVKNAKEHGKGVSDLKAAFKISKEIATELETDLKS